MGFTKEYQGKVVVEPNGATYLVMFPDGTVKGFESKEEVEQAARTWFKQHLGADIGVGKIEWRS